LTVSVCVANDISWKAGSSRFFCCLRLFPPAG
jgi:hypothetical protein